MKRNFMQSKIVKQLSIVHYPLSIINCTLLIVFCFLFGGKAWGQTTLLSENFDNMSISNSYSSSDWYAYNAGNGNNWERSDYEANSGSYSVLYEYNEDYSANCYLVSPPFSVTANMTRLNISLYEKTWCSGSWPEKFEVFFVKANDFSTAAGVVSATHYSAIASATYTNDDDFDEISGSNTNSALAGQSVRAVIHCTSDADMNALFIDDITVTETTSGGGGGVSTTCPVYVNWTKSGNGDNHSVSYTYTDGNDNQQTITSTTFPSNATINVKTGTTITLLAKCRRSGRSVTITAKYDDSNGTTIANASASSTGNSWVNVTQDGIVNCAASSCTKTITYTYGFEDASDYTCWTKSNLETCSDNSNMGGGIYNSSSYARTGSKLFIFSSYCGETEPQYLISPELSGVVNGVHVEFDYAIVDFAGGAPETFNVGYSTTDNNESSFTWLQQDITCTSSTYEHFKTNFMGNVKYIAVKYTSADSYYLFLDDFIFEEVPSCLEPTNVAASNISATGATISWTAGGSETSWDLFYTNNPSTVPGSGTTPSVSGITSSSKDLTGLDPASTYYAYVRAACGGSDKSDWSLVCTFSTECNAMSLPYTNDFETGALTVCWTAINESPVYMSTNVLDYSPNNGTYHLELDRRTSTGTQIIVLPEVDASYALTGYEVSFYAMLSNKGNGSYTSANRTLTIGVMTDPTDPSTFVQVGIVSPTDTYALYTVSLSGYSGNGHYIAIKHDETTSGNNGYTFIDDLKVSTPPPTKIVASSTHAADEMTWAEFAGYVNGGYSYSGKIVTLMENISVSAMVGNSPRPFRGTFEGNEHKITVSISSSEQGAAPFRYIDGATIQNLEVDGTVTSTAHHASGLVGFCADGTNTIQNCLVSTNVTNTNPYSGDSGNNYMGGIIGHNMEATTSIIGCVYNGTLTSEGFKGGMVGFGNYNSNVTITNSYFAGAYSAHGYSDPNFSPIACHGSGRNFNFTFSNFYYNTDAGIFTVSSYEGTVNATYSGTGRAKHGYTITGESPVVVAVSGDDTEYDVSGITAYSTGIVYDGDIIAGAGDNVALTLSSAPAGYNYEADYGTLTGSGSSYTLDMTGNNTKIYAVTCFRPDNLEVSANNNSITITWDDNNASEWQVAVHTSDDGNPGNHIVGTVSERTYAVSSLAINQTRYLWVRAYCSASDQSVWIGPVNATTHCTEPTGLTATPFTTGAVLTWDSGTDEEYTVDLGTPVFLNVTDAELINESFEGGSMPDGWTSEGDATWSVGSGDYSSSTGSYDGSSNALITHNAYDYETYLVTPAIDLSGATSATLSCYYINRSWAGDIDEFGIYYRINGGSWTELFSTSDAHPSWTSTGDISLSTFGANFQLGFKMTDNYGYGVAIDKIVFSVTGNLPTGDYTWTPVTSSATMPYTLTGLTMGNTYYVRVKDQCDNTSDVVAFSPACTSPSDLAVEPSNRSAEVTWLGGDSYNLRYRTAFVGLPEEGFSSAPSGWFFRTGALNNDGTASLSGTSSWSRGTYNNVFDSHIYMNLYNTKNYWLITPSISIQDDCLFNFDVAYTAYSGSNATPAQNCTTHRFAVLISTDNMESWTILREWNNNGSSYSLDGISTTGDNVSISLSSYAGQTAYIAFFAHSETTSYDNNIHFDNVKIGNEPGSWMPSSSGTSASSPYTISNLSSETTYEVQVQATCEGDWNTSATFTTLPEYTVSASVTPAEAGTISGDGIYAEGATCTLIATVEDDCYTFENWTENGTPVSTNATYSFTVTEDMDLVANFTLNSHTVTVDAGEGGTASGSGTYNCGENTTLTATPSSGYYFYQWNDGNTDNPRTINITSNVTYTATFKQAPLTINNTTDWNNFAEAVSRGYNYSGETVTQTADIEVTAMVGANGLNFCGTFDGGCNTITFTDTVTQTEESYQYTAPFRYISNATIQNLKVAGSVTSSNKFAGGIVGRATGNCTIVNCINSTVITATNPPSNNGSHGGIVGQFGGTSTGSTIRGCVFNGQMIGSNIEYWCGILGYYGSNSITIENCLFIPASVNISANNNNTICREGNATVTNCYYTQTMTNQQGTRVYSVTGGTGVGVSMQGSASTSYSCSGLDFYTSGLTFNGTIYGSSLALSLGYEGLISGYTTSNGELSGSSHTGVNDEYTLASLSGNAIINQNPCPFDNPPAGLIWKGGTDGDITNWEIATNWAVYNESESRYQLAGSAPSESSDVFIVSNDACNIEGVPSLSSNEECNDITLNGIGVNIADGKYLTVNGTATFTSGIVTGDVTFGSGAMVSGASPSSYVNGKVTRNGMIGAFTFPTGTATLYAPFMATSSNASNVSVQYAAGHDGMPDWWNHSGNFSNVGLDHASDRENWQVSASASTELSSIILYWNEADYHSFEEGNDALNSYLNVAAVKRGGFNWQNLGMESIDGDYDGAGSITAATPLAITVGAKAAGDGDYFVTFASSNSNLVLPIELLSFSATCNGKYAELAWSTASERNNDYFVIERSEDAKDFVEVGRVAGAGNSIEQLDYTYNDYGIHGGDNYYRLVQVDYDGTRTASEIVVANCVESAIDGEPEVMAYPNPFNGELTLVLDNFDNRAAIIEVYDMLGKLIYTEKASAPQNSYETILNLSNLPSGAYTVRVSTNDFVINRNVVKQ